MHSPGGGVPFRAISSGLHWALVVAVFRLLRPFVLGLAKQVFGRILYHNARMNDRSPLPQFTYVPLAKAFHRDPLRIFLLFDA
jgi:hypothetical protein